MDYIDRSNLKQIAAVLSAIKKQIGNYAATASDSDTSNHLDLAADRIGKAVEQLDIILS